MLAQILCGALLAAPFLSGQTQVRYDAGTISGLPARNIGSAAMSGRIAAVTAVNEDGRLTVFAGSASGGVWKSVNGGTTFKPVFDNPAVQSMGAVAIDPRNPKNVWAGHRRNLGPQQRLHRRRHLQIHRWRRELDQRRPAGFRAHRQNPHRPGRRQHRLRLRHRTPLGRQHRARRLQNHRRRQDLAQDAGRRQPFDRMRHARDESGSPRRSTLRSGTSAARPGPSARAAPAAGCLNPPMAASTGPSSRPPTPKDSRRSPTAASRSPWRLPSRRWSTPRSNPQERPLPLRRWRPHLGRARCQPVHGVAPVLLRQPDRRSQGRKQSLQGGRLAASLTDGGHSFGAVSGIAHGDFHDVWIDPGHTDTVFCRATMAACGAVRMAALAGST